jgi:hypothetical protein
MAEREPRVGTGNDRCNDRARDIRERFSVVPPDPVPVWDVDNDTLTLFADEAPTAIQRMYARRFLQTYLYDPVLQDTVRMQDERPQITPALLQEQHLTYMDFLTHTHRRTDPRFSLRELGGAVQREYARAKFLYAEPGRTDMEQEEYALAMDVYQRMQALVTLAILSHDGGEKDACEDGSVA